MGAAPQMLLSSVIARNNTSDLMVQHPGTYGSIDVIFERAKTSIDDASPLAVFLVDPVEGEIVTEGHTQWGPTFALATDLYYLLNQGWNTGLMNGGELLATSTSSLVITATAGVGYVMVPTPLPLHVSFVSWDTPSIVLPALTESFIFIDQNGVLQSSPAEPSREFAILLGKAYTTNAGVLFTQEFPTDANHTGGRLSSAIENSFGVVYVSGSLVSSTTANQLNVTTGDYVFGTHQYSPSGGSPISFSTWMLSGGGGYMLSDLTNPITNIVDTLKWDTGTGLLSFIPTGSVTKHVLYIAGDDIYEHYLLQYGQQLFDSVENAQRGPIPPQPSIWTGDIAKIAALIVGPSGALLTKSITSTGVIYSIQDLRPLPSYTGTTVSGVTVHGDLAGLLADNHPQYLLVNGTRAMTGDLNMNGNNIIMNNGLVDGVLVHQHGSRHLPLGADPITTAIAVDIGTSNQVGIQNSLARSDHVHNHANQPGGSLHAVATTSVAGFMSAADKTLLDSLISTTNQFVLKAGDTMMGNLTHSAGTGDVYNGSSGAVTIQAPNVAVTPYSLLWPTMQGSANQPLTLLNAGTGQLGFQSATALGYILQNGNSPYAGAA